MLKLKDFLLICSIYPEFDKKIQQTNKDRTKPPMVKSVGTKLLAKILMDLKKTSDRGSINNSKLEATDQSAAS